MYCPRYCAQCGHRIERERWRFWHSRYFCSTCARVREPRRRILIGLVLLASIAVGFILGRLTGRSAPSEPSLEIERLVPGNMTPLPAARTFLSTPRQVLTRCGALTRSGRPCQRPVRGGGRCWQHRAQEISGNRHPALSQDPR